MKLNMANTSLLNVSNASRRSHFNGLPSPDNSLVTFLQSQAFLAIRLVPHSAAENTRRNSAWVSLDSSQKELVRTTIRSGNIPRLSRSCWCTAARAKHNGIGQGELADKYPERLTKQVLHEIILKKSGSTKRLLLSRIYPTANT